MVPVTTKGKEKVIEETPKRKSFTRATSQKLMGDVIKSGEVVIEFPTEDVVDVSNELSENEFVDDDITAQKRTRGRTKKSQNLEHLKSRRKTLYQKERERIHKGRRNHQRQNENNLLFLSINLNRDPKYLGGRVFDPEIITKPGMDSLADFVEIQSWNHLFMTKSPILHEEKVREFYYNVNFADDGNLNTMMGNKSLHLELPKEGTRFVVGKYYTKKFAKEYSKLPDMHHADIQKKLMKGEYQLLFEFVNKVLLPRMRNAQ
ncbi:hypothetical protein KY285_007754 [Solanum tuberosum]|nr:hypothetical protein KY285_007754 [Solanum tuberosum]